ncbi:MAG: hypothetical protein FVQ79_04150 [Planctomycetes bacterium]|nr:hypothetical protein [Planctomycetota bacterium]
MSSYVVDPKTINIIIHGLYYASKYQQERNYPSIRQAEAGQPNYQWMHTELYIQNPQEAASLGETLYKMNINATNQRYPNDTPETLPGTYENGQLSPYCYQLVSTDRNRVYKAIGKYLYQCNEGDVDQLPLFITLQNWYDELAHKIARMFIDELEEKRNLATS